MHLPDHTRALSAAIGAGNGNAAIPDIRLSLARGSDPGQFWWVSVTGTPRRSHSLRLGPGQRFVPILILFLVG